VDNFANALLSPSTKSRSGPRRLLKVRLLALTSQAVKYCACILRVDRDVYCFYAPFQESARLKEGEDDAQGAAYLAYKVLIVDNQATRQKQFQFKAKSSSEVILRLSLKAVSVYPRTSKTVPAITEIDYRSLKAVTLKGMDERSYAM
jgi:hypothetical protein